MSVRTVLAAVAAGACLAATAAAADPLREPWAGFEPGSYVHQQTTTKTGLPRRADTVTESRTTLLEAARGAVTLKSEFRVGDGAWQEQKITLDPSAQGAAETGKPEPLGEEKLTVDGRELACRKQRTVVGGTTTVSWVHPDLGVVRSESQSAEGARTTLALEHLAVKQHAGEQDVECRQVTTVVTTPVGTSTTTMWLSPAMPGGVVRSETVTEQGKSRLTMTTVTLDFLAKRRG